MKTRHRAFTLVELLVVIGIIAVLISILLPSLSKARQQASTVVCASNLRQLYQAMQIYSVTNRQYVLPSKSTTGNDKQALWCGFDLLGPCFGVKMGGTASSTDQQAAIDRIGRMLRCPAVLRASQIGGSATAFSVCYTYNENLGSTKGQNFTGNSDYSAAKYDPWLAFKKTNQVPQNVIIAVDGYDSEAIPFQTDDLRFMNLGDLTNNHRRAGWPHNKRANFLFNDGTVHTVNPWASTVKNPYGVPLNDPTLIPNPVLTSSLIVAPQVFQVQDSATRAKFTTTDVWQRGTTAPF